MYFAGPCSVGGPDSHYDDWADINPVEIFSIPNLNCGKLSVSKLQKITPKDRTDILF